MIYWIWLNTIDGLGPVMQRKLLNHFKNPKNIFDADEYEIMKVKNLGIIRAKEIKNTSLEKSTLSDGDDLGDLIINKYAKKK